MPKGSLVLFVACGFIICMCLADRTDRTGSLNIKVKRLVRKTNNLQNEVDDIWRLLSSGTHVQDNDNKTQTDNAHNSNECMEKVDKSVAMVKKLESDVKHFVATWRSGFKDEKKWQRETLGKLKELFDDFQTSVKKKQLDGFRAKHYKLETENQILVETVLEMQRELKKFQGNHTLTETTTTSFLHSCDDDWIEFNGHCYHVVKKKVTWSDASSYCRNRTSYLMEITTDIELEFANELSSHFILSKLWTGTVNNDIEGRFVYQRSKDLIPEKYWREGEPEYTLLINQRCICMRWHSIGGDFELYDRPCYYRHNFVCEKP